MQGSSRQGTAQSMSAAERCAFRLLLQGGVPKDAVLMGITPEELQKRLGVLSTLQKKARVRHAG